MPLLPISSQDLGWNPTNITRAIVAGLLPFALVGCSTQKLGVTTVEPIPFWTMEYTVHTGASDHMALTYGWRYIP